MSSISSVIEKLSDLFTNATFAESDRNLINDILPEISNIISRYLDDSKNSPLSKLALILSSFSKLKSVMETPLWKNILNTVGYVTNFEAIVRNICFHAGSFPELIDQSAYAAALQKFPSSEFPLLLADLPIFLKANLLDKYETLKEEASEAAAAAEEARLESTRLKFRETFAKCWAEVPAEHLPALKDGMDLKRKLSNDFISSLTKKQLELLKNYDEFTNFVHLKMRENKFHI